MKPRTAHAATALIATVVTTRIGPQVRSDNLMFHSKLPFGRHQQSNNVGRWTATQGDCLGAGGAEDRPPVRSDNRETALRSNGIQIKQRLARNRYAV